MSKKSMFGSLAAVAAFSLTIMGVAFARQVPANMGHATALAGVGCFIYDVDTGKVTTSCNTVDFVTPLPIDNTGTKSNVRFTGRATQAGAKCRVIGLGRFANNVSASPFVEVNVNPGITSHPLADITVPTTGIMLADCQLNSGVELLRLELSPVNRAAIE